MNRQTKRKFTDRANIMKALAHPTRLFIVDQLSRRRFCVNELRDLIEADMSTVSRHLAVLRNAGIVSDEKRGLEVWYSLRAPCILNFFGCLESILHNRTHPDLIDIEDRTGEVCGPQYIESND